MELLKAIRSQPADAVSSVAAKDQLQFIQFYDWDSGLGFGHDYRLPKIVGARPTSSGQPPEIDALLDTIMSCTVGGSYEFDGKSDSFTLIANLLVVRQTLAVHEEVEVLLEALTAVANKRAPATAIRIRAKTDDGSAERKARGLLSKKTTLEFSEFPLQ